jgi:probable F420-dependent oxidoreductase
MNFGFSIPTRGPLATREGVLALAGRGEDLGFAYVALPDHIVIPRHIASPYPYNPARKMAGAESGDCLEQLALLAFLAAATRRIRLLTSIMVVPHRPPVFTAKALATIDVLSQGRVVVGAGAGWMDEEFQALGAPPFAERGRVTDEYLRAFKTLWTEDDPRFEGRYARFAGMPFSPKPVQSPSIPIVVGGVSRAAIRRAARLGDGWQPLGLSPEALRDGMTTLREEARAHGRDATDIPVSLAMTLGPGRPGRATLGTDRNEIARKAQAYADLGVDALLVSAVTADPAQARAALEMVAAAFPR